MYRFNFTTNLGKFVRVCQDLNLYAPKHIKYLADALSLTMHDNHISKFHQISREQRPDAV